MIFAHVFTPAASSPDPRSPRLRLLTLCLSLLLPLGWVLLTSMPAFAAIPAPVPGPGVSPNTQPANQTSCIQHAEAIAQPQTMTLPIVPWIAPVTISLPDQNRVPLVDGQGTTLGHLTLYRSLTCPGTFYGEVNAPTPVIMDADLLSLYPNGEFHWQMNFPTQPTRTAFSPLYQGPPTNQVCAVGIIQGSVATGARACTAHHTSLDSAF